MAREIRRLNGSVKIRGAPRILAHLIAIAAISVVNLTRFCFIRRIDFAAVIQKVGQPVVVLLVFLDGVLHYLGLDDFVIAGDDALCALDDPRKYSAARRFEQEVRIVLDVGLALNLGVERENVQWMVENVPFEFDAIVVDELSSFKNWNSKRFKSLMKVRPRAKRVIGLTGTPSGNGLMDLFAEFKVLDMGQRLGRFITKYRQDYFRPDRMNGQVVYSYKPLPGAEKRIYDKISDITISMKAADHLKMPELINSEYRVYMEEPEQAIYDEMCEDLAAQLDKGEVTAANAGVLSGKLCQMANGAVYTDNGDVEHIHDQKLDALEDIIESMNGKPLLVAYWYQHDLDRIEERLRLRKIGFARLDSDASIAKWNRGEIPVALIHPASAGHGLNLQSGGATLCWFGITWSLELYQQTVARLYRQGQASKTVVVQHIITDGTIDERIMKALQYKDRTQSALIDAVRANLRK